MNKPLRSFQFKLLIFVMLVGSIPLVCALFIFYYQANESAKKDMVESVDRIHRQTIEMLQEELLHLDRIADTINSDYVVQQFVESNEIPPGFTEIRFKQYLDFLISRHKSGSRYVTDICISFESQGKSVCTNVHLFFTQSRRAPVNIRDRSFTAYSDGRTVTSGVMFVAPVYHLSEPVVKGQIAVVFNLGKRVRDFAAYKSTDDQQIIYLAEGDVAYRRGSDIAPTEPYDEAVASAYIDPATKKIVSMIRMDVLTTPWVSRIEAGNRFLTSTWATLRDTLIVFIAVVLIFSAISSIIFTTYVTKPLLHLRSLFQRAASGDLQAYWTSKNTQEIDDLGDAYNQMLNRVADLIKQVKIEEALKKEAEIKALHYQMNPHFLYNTLNTIKWVAKIHKTPQISDVVSALVRLLQASLGKRGDFLTLREEISLIQDYMEIQHFRYGEFVRLEYEIDSFASLCLVPRMILQPLVENALIHGIEPTNREGIVKIKAWIDRDLLYCEVSDNGKGIPPERWEEIESKPSKEPKERMSGIGIMHIREKIKLYYGPDYKMLIFSKPSEGTTIRLSLPIHRNEV